MKILKKEKLPQSQVKLVIEVSRDELAKFIDQAFEKLKNEVKIDGFRPGKAPRAIIEKELGSERFQQKALEIALSNTYYQAIKESQLFPLGPPGIKLVKFVPSDILVYEATISIIPEFELKDYKKKITGSAIKRQKAKVEEKQIEGVIKNLQRQKATTKEVLREARKGDKVEVDFEGFVDGKPIPEGSSKNHPIVLGEGVMVPGFEEALLGIKKGEEKEFELILPNNFSVKDFAGKKARFKVKMKKVTEIKLPKADDQFARDLNYKNISELKEAIRESLEKEFLQKEELRLEGEIIEELIKDLEIEIPQVLIEEEKKEILKGLEQQLSNIGLTLDRYLEQIKKNREELEKGLEEEAKKKIKIALVLDKIAQKEDIQVDEKEVEEEIKKIIEQTMPDKKEEVRRGLENEEQKRYIKNVLKNKKVMEFLKSLVKKTS